MKFVSSVFGGMGLGAVLTIFAVGGCGGDKSAPPTSTGGAPNGGSASDVGGSTNGGGNTSTGGGNKGTGGATSGPAVVPRALMTDFSEIAEGTQATTANPSLAWGDSSKGLTGGTFLYQQADADALTGTITNAALHLSGNIAANDYAGFGFYFGPNQGSDASKYSGFSFTLSGSLGNSTVDVQMQMTPDYPLHQSNKGTCDYVTADAGMWVYCKNPHVSLSTLLPGGVTTAAQTVQVPWTSLTGGNPVSAIDPTQLLGIQFQFNCGTAACAVDVTLDDLTFYPGS